MNIVRINFFFFFSKRYVFKSGMSTRKKRESNLAHQETLPSFFGTPVSNMEESMPPSKRAKQDRYREPVVHASQNAVFLRIKDAIFKHTNSVLLNDDPGHGKTRIQGKVMSFYDGFYKKRNKGEYVLQISVVGNKNMPKEHYIDLGMNSYSLLVNSQMNSMIQELKQHRYVRTFMSFAMARTLFFGNARDEKKNESHGRMQVLYEFCEKLKELPSQTMVIFYFDEVHSFVGRKKKELIEDAWAEIQKACGKGIQFRAHGITATLPSKSKASIDALLLAKNPKRSVEHLKMTQVEQDMFRTDMFKFKPKPLTSKNIEKRQLCSPHDDPIFMKNYQEDFKHICTLFLGLLALYSSSFKLEAGKELKHYTTPLRQKLTRLLEKIVACIFIDIFSEKIGGYLMKSTGKIGMARYNKATASPGPQFDGYPGVLISCSNYSGTKAIADKFQVLTSVLEDDEEFGKVHDLREKGLKLYNNASSTILDMNKDVQAQKGPVFALIQPSQRKSTNMFASNCHVVHAIDGSTDADTADGQSINQLLGRISRATPLQDGELIPAQLQAYAWSCEWADHVRDIVKKMEKDNKEAIADAFDQLLKPDESVLHKYKQLQNENDFHQLLDHCTAIARKEFDEARQGLNADGISEEERYDLEQFAAMSVHKNGSELP